MSPLSPPPHFLKIANLEGECPPERETCARTQIYNNENILKVNSFKIKKVDKVKFLGIIIDDQLNWDAHIEHLIAKLKASIVTISREL